MSILLNERKMMNDVQWGCLTYKYSLIAVILVPIICTLSMSLLVSLASTVPTTVNNRFRFSHDVLRRRVFGEFQRELRNCQARMSSPWQRDRPSDRRNMDREQFVVFFVFLINFQNTKLYTFAMLQLFPANKNLHFF